MEVIASSLCYENDSVNPAPHKDSLVREVPRDSSNKKGSRSCLWFNVSG